MIQDEWADLPPWKRAMFAWRQVYGRTGFTIQGLSAVLRLRSNTAAHELLAEWAADPHSYSTRCETEYAYMMCWGPGAYHSVKHLPSIQTSLRAFPVPRFRTVQNDKGCRDLHKVSPRELKGVRLAADGGGKWSTWGALILPGLMEGN